MLPVLPVCSPSTPLLSLRETMSEKESCCPGTEDLLQSNLVLIAVVKPSSRVLMDCVLSRSLLGQLISSQRHSESF